jgi:hypothetical protein
MWETVSAGLLMFGGSTIGVGMVYALAALIDLRAAYSDVYTPASIFIVATMMVCVACYFSLNGTMVICLLVVRTIVCVVCYFSLNGTDHAVILLGHDRNVYERAYGIS